MEKKLYYEVSDLGYIGQTVEDLESAMALIDADIVYQMEDEKEPELQYTITPVWMTEEEFNNLPEFNG